MSYMDHCIKLTHEDGDGWLALFSSQGEDYIGIVRNNYSDFSDSPQRYVMVFNPLRYMEGLYGDPNNPGSAELRVGMDSIFRSLVEIEDMFFVIDKIYFLNREREKDQRLATSYADTLREISAKKSGLVAPTLDDIRKVHGAQ